MENEGFRYLRGVAKKYTKFENKIVGVILKQYRYLFFVAFSFIGVLIRYCGRNFVSNDMYICLIPLFAEISNCVVLKSLVMVEVGNH